MRHRGTTPRPRPLGIVLVGIVVLGLGSGIGSSGFPACSAWAKVETWRQEGPSAFAKSHRERVVLSDTGRARLGHAVSPVGSVTAGRVWDLARTRDGALLAATGDAGQIFRREP